MQRQRAESDPESSGRDRALRKGREDRGNPRFYAEDRANALRIIPGTNGIVADRKCLVCDSELETREQPARATSNRVVTKHL
jgi:hypothetical protein